jgi:hypothetical protein
MIAGQELYYTHIYLLSLILNTTMNWKEENRVPFFAIMKTEAQDKVKEIAWDHRLQSEPRS